MPRLSSLGCLAVTSRTIIWTFIEQLGMRQLGLERACHLDCAWWSPQRPPATANALQAHHTHQALNPFEVDSLPHVAQLCMNARGSMRCIAGLVNLADVRAQGSIPAFTRRLV